MLDILASSSRSMDERDEDGTRLWCRRSITGELAGSAMIGTAGLPAAGTDVVITQTVTTSTEFLVMPAASDSCPNCRHDWSRHDDYDGCYVFDPVNGLQEGPGGPVRMRRRCGRGGRRLPAPRLHSSAGVASREGRTTQDRDRQGRSPDPDCSSSTNPTELGRGRLTGRRSARPDQTLRFAPRCDVQEGWSAWWLGPPRRHSAL